MILNVPVVRQKPNSVSCGIISTYMVLDFNGYSTSLGELFKNIELHKKKSTIAPAIVKGLIKLGIRSELILSIPSLLSSLSKKEIEKKIKKFKNDEYLRTFFKKVLEVLESVKMDFITINMLKYYIKKRKPVIVGVNSPVMRQRNYGKLIEHFVVLRGYTRKSFIINDPHWKFGGVLEIPYDVFIASIYSGRVPSIIVVVK